MISLKEYGFRSRAVFLRSTNIDHKIFELMSNNKDWKVQKSVLYHLECPLDIRIKFSQDKYFYKRIVAFFNVPSPYEFWKRAKDDKSVHVGRIYTYSRHHQEKQDTKRFIREYSNKLEGLLK